ncbi:serine/threonine-protein kinase pakD, partial [Cherax quadricarinatus]
MERREKKERQKDRREARKITQERENRDEERQKHMPEQTTSQDVRKNENRELIGGPGGPTLPTGIGSLKTPEDVVTGNSTCQTSTTKADQSQAAASRPTNQGRGKSPTDVTGALPASGTPKVGLTCTVKSGVNTAQVGGNSLQPGTDTVNSGMFASESDSLLGSLSDPVSVVTAIRVGGRSEGSCVSNSAVSNSGVSSANALLGSANVHDWGDIEKPADISSGAINAPPGFQHLAHVPVGLSSQGQTVSDHVNQVLKLSSQGHAHESQGPNNVTAVNHYHQMTAMHQQQQQKEQQKQKKQNPQQQQHPQQSLPQHRQWEFWPSNVLPQSIQLTSKSQKQEPQKPKSYQPTTTVSTTQTQQQQQQYPYSISPAALFHMASQAAGGQMSAVLLPSVSESSNNRSSMAVSTSPSVSSEGTISSSGSGAAPPPGFSAPIAINYHGQQVDPVQFNKLIMGSPLYRSPVSQSDGQSAVSNTASQSFISVSQSLSGPVAGVYA